MPNQKKAVVTKRVHHNGQTKTVKRLPTFDRKVNNLTKRTASKANKKKS